MEKTDIIIRKGIVHIIDPSLGTPVLSEALLDLNGEVNDFIREHIFKVVSGDDLKKCRMDEEDSEVYTLLKGFEEEQMIPVSKQLAEHLYGLLAAHISIPPADLLVVTFQMYSRMYLALLKLNYKESFVHMTHAKEEGNSNSIIKYYSSLPGNGSRLSEAIIIDLSDYSVSLIEKKYEINGEKQFYLSEQFLHCHAQMSQKAKLSVVKRAVDQINQKHYESDIDKKMELKGVIQKEIAEEGMLDVASLGEKLYGDTPDIKEEFTEKLEKYHVEKEQIKPQSQSTVKTFEKQYLKTDTGIEINIPMEQYHNADKVEFITNPDGTISLLIKDIGHITSK